MIDSRPRPDTRPAWPEVVREAAHQATLEEAALRWGSEELPFIYRWEHVQAVVRLALRLAELTGADRETVEAAAWLHDIRKRGKDDNHGVEGAAAARLILARTDFPAAKIEAVADAIAKHVGLFTDDPVEPLEAAVLWDADKLSKLGATAVLHFIGHHIATGDSSTQALLAQPSHQPWQIETVRSFHTAPARAAGRIRLETFRAFWEQARLEMNGDDLA